MKSEAQITQERKAWARGKLIVAWLKISKVKACRAAGDPYFTAEDLDLLEAELQEAMAIAKEWGIDCRMVVKKIEGGT